MRASALIQYANDVLHVMVHKMNPEVGEIGGPPWSLPERTVN